MKNKVNLGVLLALLSGLLWSLNTLLFSILIQPEGNNIIIFTIISALYNDSSSVIWLLIICFVIYNWSIIRFIFLYIIYSSFFCRNNHYINNVISNSS